MPRKDTTSPVRTTTATTPPVTSNPLINKGKRTPKSRASSSWDYVYKKKKQDFDDSLIIRRRSNSSYSSTTSINRLSIDGPVSIGNDSKSVPTSSSENDLSKTSPSSSNNNRSSGSSKTRLTPTPPTVGGKIFEFAKPEIKKSQKRTKSPAATLTNDMKKAAPVASKRYARSPATSSEDKSKESVKSPHTKSPTMAKENKKDAAPSSSTISDVMVKKSSKVAQILFSTNKAKIRHTFTIQVIIFYLIN